MQQATFRAQQGAARILTFLRTGRSRKVEVLYPTFVGVPGQNVGAIVSCSLRSGLGRKAATEREVS